MSLFRREPTIPLSFYEAQVQLWAVERAELLNRIQHPAVFQPAEQILAPTVAPDATKQPSSALSEQEEQELARVGTVVLGPEEGGGPAPASEE